MTRACLLICLILGSGRLLAQDAGRQQSIDNYIADYLRMADKQSVLYYGKEQEWYPRTTNHPYLKDEQFAKARLSYRGIIYPEALLRLDLSRNELVILSPDLRNFVLFPENVDFTELHDQTIIYHRRDSLPGCPSTGYYILLHSGSCKVLEKITANFVEKSELGKIERLYVFATSFYLYKDGVYHTIRNQRGLLKVLHPYKKELKQFILANRLLFRRNAEEFLTRTVSEYEKISGSR